MGQLQDLSKTFGTALAFKEYDYHFTEISTYCQLRDGYYMIEKNARLELSNTFKEFSGCAKGVLNILKQIETELSNLKSDNFMFFK